jgi:hypothetical protein
VPLAVVDQEAVMVVAVSKRQSLAAVAHIMLIRAAAAALTVVVVVLAVMELAVAVAMAEFVSFTPEPRDPSHQQTQVICNGTIYSNP